MADPIDPRSLEIPAAFVNKIQILVSGANVRLSFAEGAANAPSNYRAAVLMSIVDARDLALAILQALPTQPFGLFGGAARDLLKGQGFDYVPTGILDQGKKDV